MIDELSALSRIRERFQKVSKSVSLGIGDDAAAVKIDPGKLLLATTDSQIEDIHFMKKLITAKELARKSVAVSVSDIGAMGGIPKFFLATLGFSKNEDERFLEDLMNGFQSGADEFKIELIGGNLSSSNKIFIEVAVLGEVEPENIVKRTGAKPGDLVYLSGTVGDSALGRKILFNKKLESDNYLIRRHTTPKPRLTLGRELAKNRLVNSMIDISDGLILDLERLTTQNGLGAKIYIDRIPISSNYKKRIHDLSENTYNLALSGGEDYELLFSSPKNKRKEIINISRKLKTKITEIGHIAETPIIQILNEDGKESKFAERGFVHFSS